MYPGGEAVTLDLEFRPIRMICSDEQGPVTLVIVTALPVMVQVQIRRIGALLSQLHLTFESKTHLFLMAPHTNSTSDELHNQLPIPLAPILAASRSLTPRPLPLRRRGRRSPTAATRCCGTLPPCPCSSTPRASSYRSPSIAQRLLRPHLLPSPSQHRPCARAARTLRPPAPARDAHARLARPPCAAGQRERPRLLLQPRGRHGPG